MKNLLVKMPDKHNSIAISSCKMPKLLLTGILTLALGVSAFAGNPGDSKAGNGSSAPNNPNNSAQQAPRVLDDPFAGLFDWNDPFGGNAADPLAMMNQMRERMHQQMAQMDKLFAQSFGSMGSMGSMGAIGPMGLGNSQLNAPFGNSPFAGFNSEMTLDDQGDKYIVTIDQPDLDKYKFNVTVEDNVVTVTGTRQEVQEKSGSNQPLTSHSELNESFTRSLALPSAVDADKVNVENKDGELIISIPKSGGGSLNGSHSGGVQYRRQKPTHIGGKVI